MSALAVVIETPLGAAVDGVRLRDLAPGDRLNELEQSESNTGFRTILVSEADRPFWEHWWPHGHMIGWEDNFVHELFHLLTCIREDTPVGPRGATMEDGYRCAEICDAIVRSHETGQRQEIAYRSL